MRSFGYMRVTGVGAPVGKPTMCTCDLCGAEVEKPGSSRSRWRYNNSADFSAPTGRGLRVTNHIDLCPACVQRRLLPWLREQGLGDN